MRIMSLFACAVVAFVPVLSSAAVMYEWKPLNDKLPQGIDLRLQFDDAAVAAGAFSFHLTPTQPGPTGQPIPESGLLSLLYTFPDGPGMSYNPREEAFRDGWGKLILQSV